METLVQFLNIETEMVEEVEYDLQETLEDLGIEIEYVVAGYCSGFEILNINELEIEE